MGLRRMNCALGMTVSQGLKRSVMLTLVHDSLGLKPFRKVRKCTEIDTRVLRGRVINPNKDRSRPPDFCHQGRTRKRTREREGDSK